VRVCESFFSSSVTLVFSGLIFVYLVYLSLVHSVSVGYFNLCGLCGTLLSSRLQRFAAASSSSSTRDDASVTSRELTLCGTSPVVLFFVSPHLRRPLPLCC
jgi:hypothetical protein